MQGKPFVQNVSGLRCEGGANNATASELKMGPPPITARPPLPSLSLALSALCSPEPARQQQHHTARQRHMPGGKEKAAPAPGQEVANARQQLRVLHDPHVQPMCNCAICKYPNPIGVAVFGVCDFYR